MQAPEAVTKCEKRVAQAGLAVVADPPSIASSSFTAPRRTRSKRAGPAASLQLITPFNFKRPALPGQVRVPMLA
jgi:hypothetical protein